MFIRVSIAIIAIMAMIFATGSPSSALVQPQKASTCLDGPVSGFTVFLLVNGQYQDVTGQTSYSENHVFLLGQYIGDRTGPDNLTIVSPSGAYLGYMQPVYNVK